MDVAIACFGSSDRTDLAFGTHGCGCGHENGGWQHVRVSALALLKMAMHCRSGGDIEVMGLMQGKVAGDTFIVIDSFALPVEGESRELCLAA